MCGIVGASAKDNVVSFLIEGLKRLEYRGYDSVGIALHKEEKTEVYKQKGRVMHLSEKVEKFTSTCGIGHTRWATHGEPSDINSHPHVSGKFTVVHNGIIENYSELKTILQAKGYEFVSQTDTEVIAHLFTDLDCGNIAKTMISVIEKLKGSFALCVINSDFPDVIAICKKDSPLIVGKAENGIFLASDAPALAGYVDSVYVMQDGDMGLVFPDRVEFFDKDLKNLDKKFQKAELQASALELGGFESFMMKEIHESPDAINQTAQSLKLYGLSQKDVEQIAKSRKITVIGCGTAYHAGLIGKAVIEKYLRIPVMVEVASEYRYRNPIIEKGETVIAVSQSGETADTIAAVKLAKENGAKIITITNVNQSSITTFSDIVLYTKAGPEIAVAATKSYNSQLVVFYYIAYALMQKQNEFFQKIENVEKATENAIGQKEKVIEIARWLGKKQNAFFLGRGKDYCSALEGSLKLKEITYVHSEGCPAGELKHGTLALIEKDTPVVAIITEKDLAEKTMNALHEVKARGAKVVLISSYEEYLLAKEIDDGIKIPEIEEDFAPIISIISLQMLAYYISRAKGLDPDKPRNLAKSVTVE